MRKVIVSNQVRNKIVDLEYFLINDLKPLTLISPIKSIPHVRNYFTTSYFSLLSKK